MWQKFRKSWWPFWPFGEKALRLVSIEQFFLGSGDKHFVYSCSCYNQLSFLLSITQLRSLCTRKLWSPLSLRDPLTPINFLFWNWSALRRVQFGRTENLYWRLSITRATSLEWRNLTWSLSPWQCHQMMQDSLCLIYAYRVTPHINLWSDERTTFIRMETLKPSWPCASSRLLALFLSSFVFSLVCVLVERKTQTPTYRSFLFVWKSFLSCLVRRTASG